MSKSHASGRVLRSSSLEQTQKGDEVKSLNCGRPVKSSSCTDNVKGDKKYDPSTSSPAIQSRLKLKARRRAPESNKDSFGHLSKLEQQIIYNLKPSSSNVKSVSISSTSSSGTDTPKSTSKSHSLKKSGHEGEHKIKRKKKKKKKTIRRLSQAREENDNTSDNSTAISKLCSTPFPSSSGKDCSFSQFSNLTPISHFVSRDTPPSRLHPDATGKSSNLIFNLSDHQKDSGNNSPFLSFGNHCGTSFVHKLGVSKSSTNNANFLPQSVPPDCFDANNSFAWQTINANFKAQEQGQGISATV